MRRALRIVCVCVLFASAGCAAFGPGPVDESALAEDVEYDWNTSTDATIELESGQYVAVYNLTETSSVELFRPQRLNDRAPVDPVGPAFRYPNGTVVNLTSAAVNRSDGVTLVTLPASNGSLAYTASRDGKSLRLPRTVNGSYAVVLPPGGRIQLPLLGRVLPGGYETDRLSDGRVQIRWDTPPDRDLIVVEYYLNRDFLILSGIVGASTIAVVAGVGYYLLTIRRLRRRRESVDVEYEENG